MITDFGDTAIASVLTAAIAGLVAWLTARSARKGQEAQAKAAAEAAVANQTMSSRTQIEQDAFERAKGYYTDAMDRMGAEIISLEASEVELKTKVNILEIGRQEDRTRIEYLENHVRDLEFTQTQSEQKIQDLKEKLGVATALLEQKYSDE